MKEKPSHFANGMPADFYCKRIQFFPGTALHAAKN
jgi:hypothetical protein